LAKAAVASPVGVKNNIILPGRTGLLAGTDEEWLSCLIRLIEDREKRQKLDAVGYMHVKENFSLQVWENKFARSITCADFH